MDFDPQNPPMKRLGGQNVPFTEQEWYDWKASIAPTLADVKAKIVSLKKQKENGGIIFNGARVATDAEAVADVLGGSGSSGPTLLDSGDVITINDTVLAALESAIKDYRFKVKGYAATLVTGAESSNDLSAFMASLDSGWPTNVYPL